VLLILPLDCFFSSGIFATNGVAVTAEHELSIITSDGLRERMESRFGFLNYADRYDGVYAGEYEFLEDHFTEEVEEEDEQSLNSASLIARDWENDFGGMGGASRPYVSTYFYCMYFF
jgi:hypothetical protein